MMNQMGNMSSMQGSMHSGLVNQMNVPMGNQMNQNNMNVVSTMSGPGPGQMMNTNTMSGAPMVGNNSMPNQMGMPGQMSSAMGGSALGQMSNMMNNQVLGGQGNQNIGGGMPQAQMNVHAVGPRRVSVTLSNVFSSKRIVKIEYSSR